MAPSQWTSAEQREWLEERVELFLRRQSEKRLALFWPDLFRDWFEKWPIVEPVVISEASGENLESIKEPQESRATSIFKLHKRLKEWYNNNATGKSKSRGSNYTTVLKSFQTRKRCPQAIELYSRKYYADRIQDKVRDEIKNKGLPRKEILGVIKQFTMEAFDAESEELKESFYSEAKAAKEKADKHMKEANTNTPETYAAAIDALPGILKSFFDQLSETTGWTFSVLAGGPAPLNGGKIRTLGYDSGKNEHGLSFSAAHPSYQTSFLKPFAEFVKQVFSSDVCAARALVRKVEHDVDGPPVTTTTASTVDSDSPAVDAHGPQPTLHSPLEEPSSSPTTNSADKSDDLDLSGMNPLVASATGPSDGSSSIHSRQESRSFMMGISFDSTPVSTGPTNPTPNPVGSQISKATQGPDSSLPVDSSSASSEATYSQTSHIDHLVTSPVRAQPGTVLSSSTIPPANVQSTAQSTAELSPDWNDNTASISGAMQPLSLQMTGLCPTPSPIPTSLVGHGANKRRLPSPDSSLPAKKSRKPRPPTASPLPAPTKKKGKKSRAVDKPIANTEAPRARTQRIRKVPASKEVVPLTERM